MWNSFSHSTENDIGEGVSLELWQPSVPTRELPQVEDSVVDRWGGGDRCLINFIEQVFNNFPLKIIKFSIIFNCIKLYNFPL